MDYILVNRDELPSDGNTYDFEGSQYDDTDVSFIWVDMPPGAKVRMHQHPYKEVFIIEEGSSTFTVGSDRLEAHAGQVIVVPAGVPHKFANSGQGRLRQIDIHVSKTISTQWLED